LENEDFTARLRGTFIFHCDEEGGHEKDEKGNYDAKVSPDMV
jgi:hypothetical protein